MKKNLLLVLSLMIMTSILCNRIKQSRKFYCIDGKCITVLKTAGDSCLIIIGRYNSTNKPNGNFILAKSDDIGLTIFFSDELPNALIYLSGDSLKIHSVGDFTFYDYNSNPQKFRSILYPPKAKVSRELKNDAILMHISIDENYALDKNGKQLKNRQ